MYKNKPSDNEMEFSFFHYTKRMADNNDFNTITVSGFPMTKNTRISTIYLICAEFNGVDTVSIATTHTENEIVGNIFFIKTVLTPKQNYLTLPHNITIILKLIVNVNTGKFIFSLSDNPSEINKAIGMIKVSLFYKIK